MERITERFFVTGAAGKTGAVGRTVTGLLLERGLPVRAMVSHRGRPGQSFAGRWRGSGGGRSTRTGRRLSRRQWLSNESLWHVSGPGVFGGDAYYGSKSPERSA